MLPGRSATRRAVVVGATAGWVLMVMTAFAEVYSDPTGSVAVGTTTDDYATGSLVGVSLGWASGGVVGVGGSRGARGGAVAVGNGGDQTWGGTVAVGTSTSTCTGPAWPSYVAIGTGDACADWIAISSGGCATSRGQVVGARCADGSNGAVLAVSPFGDARADVPMGAGFFTGGWSAVSGTGSASAMFVALSGTGSSTGGILAASAAGPANGGNVALSGTGPTNGHMVSVSGTGSAERGWLTVAPMGTASGGGSGVAVAGGDADAGGGTFPGLVCISVTGNCSNGTVHNSCPFGRCS